MTRHPLSRILAVGALALSPWLSGCQGCSEAGLSKIGDVDDLEDEEEEADAFSSDWGQWLSATKLSDGRVGIAYYDRDQGGIGFGVGTPTKAGVEWSHEPIDGYPQENGLDAGDRGMYTSVATAPDGTVWAGFYDIGAKNLRFGERGPGGVWTNGLADVGEGMEQNAGLFASVAIDKNGKPVIAHYDKGAQTLRVAHYKGGSFSGEVVDRGEDLLPADTGSDLVEANVGMYARLRIADGVEYIAYYDKAHGDLKLAVGKSGRYDIHTVDDEGDVGAWPDMVIRGGKVHLAYQHVGKQHLIYAVGVPGEDFEFTTVDRGDLVGADTALFFEGGEPNIVYYDGFDSNMKLARFDGESWSKSTVRRKGAVGFHNEVVTVGGKSYAACFNYTKRNVFLTQLD